jgi:microcystin degradation protein MlrC
MRIAIAGMAIESCTFSPLTTTLEDFTLWRGSDLLARYPSLAAYADVTFVPLLAARALFTFPMPADSVGRCIERAMQAIDVPVFISDAGDNVTAGALGDVPYVLERLLAHGVTRAVLASLVDAAAVAAVEAACWQQAGHSSRARGFRRRCTCAATGLERGCWRRCHSQINPIGMITSSSTHHGSVGIGDLAL